MVACAVNKLSNSGSVWDDQPLSKRDQQSITIDHDRETGLRFRLEGLTGQLIQGELRLVTTDPLEYDNTVPFTVRILPPLNQLAVVDLRLYAAFWTAAIDGINESGAANKSTVITPAQWDATALEKYDVVCWLHVTRPTEAMWTRLTEFVETGGRTVRGPGRVLHRGATGEWTRSARLQCRVCPESHAREAQSLAQLHPRAIPRVP